VLDESFLRSLASLRLATPRRRPGNLTGERRSTRRGRSIEFADYRNYTPGDDPRRVDWNVYARLEKPYIKLYEDEQDISIHLLLDASPSMLWRGEDEPASGKWTRAAQLAIALGAIALAGGDRLILELSTRDRWGPKAGASATSDLISFIEARTRDLDARYARRENTHAPSAGLNAWLKRYAADARPGVCLLISDLLDPQGCGEGLIALGASRLDARLLHTLCPAELEPELAGDLRLKDVESAAAQDVSLDEATLRLYRERLAAWSAETAALCRARGGRYRLIDTAAPIERIVLRDLRREGWLV
jgi:uncharacterized protein (DUF58 family)